MDAATTWTLEPSACVVSSSDKGQTDKRDRSQEPTLRNKDSPNAKTAPLGDSETKRSTFPTQEEPIVPGGPMGRENRQGRTILHLKSKLAHVDLLPAVSDRTSAYGSPYRKMRIFIHSTWISYEVHQPKDPFFLWFGWLYSPRNRNIFLVLFESIPCMSSWIDDDLYYFLT